MNSNVSIKSKLHLICLDLVKEKIDTCNSVLQKINEAKLSDTKSSAGDKFETSREMLQGEEDRTTATLSNALILKKTVNQINPNKLCSKVELGALVIGSKQSYYICVGLGKIKLDGEAFWAISMASPIAKEMRGKVKGDSFVFNGKDCVIADII